MELLLQCGFQIFLSTINLSMKETLVMVLVDYHCIVKTTAMKGQFRQGLNMLDVLSIVEAYPLLMNKYFVKTIECDIC